MHFSSEHVPVVREHSQRRQPGVFGEGAAAARSHDQFFGFSTFCANGLERRMHAQLGSKRETLCLCALQAPRRRRGRFPLAPGESRVSGIQHKGATVTQCAWYHGKSFPSQ